MATATAQNKSANLIKVGLNGKDTLALVDTGASRSVASEDCRKQIGATLQPLEQGEISQLFAADGRVVKIQGKIDCDININGLIIPFKILIVNQLTQKIIIGQDFLQHTQAKIDYSDNTVTFYDDMVGANLLNNFKNMKNIVRVSKSCRIPARTEALIQGFSSKNSFRGNQVTQSFLLEALSKQPSQDYLIARTLTIPRQSKVVCRIINPTNRTLRFYKNQAIAKLEEIRDEDIMDLPEDFAQLDLKAPQDLSPLSADGCPPPVTPLSQNDKEQNSTPSSQHQKENKQPAEQNSTTIKEEFPKIEQLGIKIDSPQLTEDQKLTLKRLLERNADIFSTGYHDLPGMKNFEHKIELSDSTPVRVKAYKCSPYVQAEMDKQIKEMLEYGIIAESRAIFQAPTLMVRKPNNELRFTVDYRRLNKVVVPTYYPMPSMSDVQQAIGEARSQIFSTMDLKAGFFQIPLEKSSQDMSTFVTSSNQSYKFLRMPQGLASSAQAFQHAMSIVFRDMSYKQILVYADDLILFSPCFITHCEHLQMVFDRLRNANLRLHPTKCAFGVESVKYLGHILTPTGIKVNPAKIEIIRNYPVPKNVAQLRSWLGLTNYFKRFLRNHAKITHPLYALLKKDEPYIWKPECQEAFESLKDLLCSAPTLTFPRYDKPFRLTTDACTTGIAWILSQDDETGTDCPISFGGRTLTKAEQNYSICELESLAILCGIRTNHQMLSHCDFTVFTDHVSCQYLQSIKSMNGRLLRWSLLLQNYRFKIQYKPGRTNQPADAVSRVENLTTEAPDADDEIYEQIAQITDSVIETSTATIEPESLQESMMRSTEDETTVKTIESEEEAETNKKKEQVEQGTQTDVVLFSSETYITLCSKNSTDLYGSGDDTADDADADAEARSNAELAGPAEIVEDADTAEIVEIAGNSGIPEIARITEIANDELLGDELAGEEITGDELVSDRILGDGRVADRVAETFSVEHVEQKVSRIHLPQHVIMTTTLNEEQKQEQNDNLNQKELLATEILMSDIPNNLQQIYINAMDDLETLQKNCPNIGGIWHYLDSGILPDDQKAARRIVYESESCHIDNGLLYHQQIPKDNNLRKVTPLVKQLVVPDHLRPSILVAFHDNRAHCGVSKTYTGVLAKYYFPGLYRFCKNYVRTCEKCQTAKKLCHPAKPSLKPLPVVDLWGRWHIDILSIKPADKRTGNKYILVMIESTSKWIECAAIQNQSAPIIAEALFRDVIARFGCPVAFLSDRGLPFLNSVVKALCQYFVIHHYHTASYSPSTNGAVEKANSTILQALRCYLDSTDNWEEFLAPVLAALRGTVNKATGFSPAFILYGRELVYPIDLELMPKVVPKSKTAEELMAKLIPRMEAARAAVQANLIEAQKEMARTHDERGTREPTFKPGDFVLIKENKAPLGISQKIFQKYSTKKYYVTGKTEIGNFLLRDALTNKPCDHPVNPSRLRLFHTDRDLFMDTHEDVEAPDDEDEEDDEAEEPTTSEGAPTEDLSPSAGGLEQNDVDVPTPATPGEVHPAGLPQQDISQFEPAKEIIGVKTQKGKRMYRVRWEDESLDPSWVEDQYVPPILKIQYHIHRTQKGILRRNLRPKIDARFTRH